MTTLYQWGLWGPFRAISELFYGPEQVAGACLEPTQNNLNGPKSGTVGQGITILCWWGHFGATLGRRARSSVVLVCFNCFIQNGSKWLKKATKGPN